jgi:hypothetical protein
MNEQLLRFIELCLTDGIISEKEREVIFRKAKELNVDTDECEIILESLIQQKNIGLPNKNINEYDSLFNDALELVLNHKEFSIDFLKFKLKLGSNRALKLFEQLNDSNKIPKHILENLSNNEKQKVSLNSVSENRSDIVQNKLHSLGLNSVFIKLFNEGKYNRLWKVNCYLSEPIYLKGNLKIAKWVDSNVSFFVPSVGNMEEKNAIAFIKGNWERYNEFICNKSWFSKGSKYDYYNLNSFDKRKIEIIEIVEIEI